jgi:hypothetical protein
LNDATSVEAHRIIVVAIAMWPVVIVSVGLWALFCGNEMANGRFSVRGLFILTTIIAFDAAILGVIVRALARSP